MIEIDIPESSQLAPRAPSPDAVAVCRARGTFEFTVDRYSLLRDLPAGAFIQSPVYNIGGYDWCILFFPGGHAASEARASKHHVAVTIQLMTQGSLVAVSYDMGLVDQHSGAFRYVAECETAEFDTRRGCPEGCSQWHLSRFVWRCDLHHYTASYIDDDSLTIKGTLAVLKATDSPPSDLPMDLGKLLEDGEGADVTFQVAGETFQAHRMLIAARSPVFKEQLLGLKEEASSAASIVIDDIQPDVFKALLHFIYTDSLPSTMDDNSNGEVIELMCRILVAADRYAIDRLVFFCEHIIARSLDVETVTTVLVLADRHNCKRLKDACLEFMISDDRMKGVVKTEGYKQVKRNNPSLLLEALEKAATSSNK